MTYRLTPVPRWMSPGFYAFMGAGCRRSESGELLMLAPEDNPRDDEQPPQEEWEEYERENPHLGAPQ